MLIFQKYYQIKLKSLILIINITFSLFKFTIYYYILIKLITDYLNHMENIQQSQKTQCLKQNQSQNLNQSQELLMDFSTMFKKTINKKPLKITSQAKSNNTNTNWLLQIPKSIKITLQDIKERKVLDLKRWICISRPQYQRSCGISSLVSVWNYLFSKIGTGSLDPVSVQQALKILGVIQKGQQFQNIDFGDFTGNFTLLKWFSRLCKHFDVKGQAKTVIKMSGQDKIVTSIQQSLQNFLKGLKGQEKGYIYHAYDHYFCPIGYQITPDKPLEAYKKLEQINKQQCQLWIIIGETSKNHPVFHVRKWKDILKDLQTQWPNFIDIRNMGKGIQRRINANETNQNEKRGTNHCIMQFSKIQQ